MPQTAFVHLHSHTEYSLLDGMIRTAAACAKTARLGMHALAITDHGNLHGALEFQNAAKAAGIKPIIGCEVYIAPGSRSEKRGGQRDSNFHTVLLAKDYQGYQNLAKLVSLGYTEGFYYKPRIDLELLGQYRAGLIALSGCLQGPLPQAILSGHGNGNGAERAIDETLDRFIQLFGRENYFLELMDHGLPEQKIVQAKILELRKKYGLELVATNDNHYLDQGDHVPHDILLCIGTGNKVRDENRLRYGADQFFIKSPQEMAALFAGVPQALANTLKIAEMCNCEIPTGRQLYPHFQPPDGQDCKTYLREIALAGLSRRMNGAVPENYRRRLDYELEVIHKTGFDAYFLIVWDFIRYALEQHIPVGPGRGSGAGSIAAWALNITDLDPIEHGLFFERFLNPERIEPPDFDIDFCIKRRNEVINYVKNKYGQRNVAQIVTFGTMKARNAIRDVGRALDVPLSKVDRIAKLVPGELKMTLDLALEQSPELKSSYDSDAEVRHMIDSARAIEGLHRHTSIHAAGVVITDQPLDELIPIFKQPGEEDLITQLEMAHVTDLGLLKMDFLGLRNLTIIAEAIQLIKELHGVEIDWQQIGYDDPQTYRLISSGHELGIFQLESAGMRAVCQQLKPTCFTDVAAVIALYRPGPMKNIPLFIDCKHGRRKVEVLHPLMEPILRETYGIIVYQEQVAALANQLAGFTLGEGDVLRKAMGKKKKDLMDEQMPKFIAGCAKNGIGKYVATRIWELMVEFAGYGFNKAHTYGYAVLTFRTAWLKANYPVEFLCALLSNDIGNLKKMPLYFQEAREMNIEILPIGINASRETFTPEGPNVRFGLAAIKNVGRSAIRAILRERDERGPFRDFTDFIQRVEDRTLNSRMIEALIKCGAFDGLGRHRAQLLAGLNEALQLAGASREERGCGQASLFEELGSAEGGGCALEHFEFPDVPHWSEKKTLAEEKELTGYYLSGHPLDFYRFDCESFANCDAARLEELEDGAEARYIGIVNKIQKRVNRNNKPFAFVEMEDFTGSVEVTFFSEALEQARGCLDENAALLITGRVNTFNEMKKILADSALALDAARRRFTREIDVWLAPQELNPQTLDRLRAIAAGHSGNVPLNLRVDHPAGGHLSLRPAGEPRVEPDAGFIEDVLALKLKKPLRFLR